MPRGKFIPPVHLVGRRFGRLVVESVEYRERPSHGWGWYADCRCNCGKVHSVQTYNLIQVKSCGCYRRDPQTKRNGERGVEIGDRSERLVVTGLIRQGGQRLLTCTCDCGVDTCVREGDFISATVKSCGCLRRELVTTRSRTHGLYGHPLYHVWRRIKDRCANPRLMSYGGRGIKMYKPWVDDFRAFKEDFERQVGPRPTPQHSLDRIDVNKGYEPGNLRWASPAAQARNRRNNRWITVGGERLCVVDWAKRLGCTAQAILKRLEFGWAEVDAVTRPTRSQRLRP